MSEIQYDEWFWGLQGGDLDAEGLEPDADGWAAVPHAAIPLPVAAEPAIAAAPGPRVAARRARGRSRAAVRRAGLAAALAAVLVVASGAFLLQRGSHGSPPVTVASSVVDPGIDIAAERSAALHVTAPVDTGPKPPGRLIIHSIGVDAQIVPVGVDKDGAMAVTTTSYDVGWYDKGPAPGDAGDAVIDGHLDWYDTSQAVFYNLRSVHIGDDLEVQRLDGTVHHFKVNGIQTVAYNATVPGLFATGGPPRLSLITCGGQWSRALNQYVSRVIVDANMVS